MKNLFSFIIFLASCSTAFATPSNFAQSVDMTPLSDNVAVFTDGRVKSFETFARSYMPHIFGSRSFEGQEASFTYFDMMIRPERYSNQDIVFIKNKNLRALVVGAVDAKNPVLQERMARCMTTGLFSREILQSQEVHILLNSLRQDVMRFATPVEQINGAMRACFPSSLWSSLQLVPPTSGSFNQPWTTLEGAPNPEIMLSWERLIRGWQDENAAEVNAELEKLAVLLPELAGESEFYPSTLKLNLESFYFRYNNLTWIWWFYLMSTVLLLMAFVYRFQRVGKLGLAMFALAVLLHTGMVVLRWIVSERYPNTNMFEAITTASWMGCLFALLMEYLIRKTAMKYIFAIGAGIAAIVALLAVHLYPLELNPHITNKMPVLHDVWLYIHVNFVIFSYCLIFVAAVCASIYLLRRVVQKIKHVDGKQDYARAGGIALLVSAQPTRKQSPSNNLGAVLDGATMILVEISFILLWSGIVMGAIWADHSWGRPWGWDPKEVFALNTFLIFVVLIHTRMKVKDKGLWTALLALIGCAVMLFNWIIINFTISGLHSYA